MSSKAQKYKYCMYLLSHIWFQVFLLWRVLQQFSLFWKRTVELSSIAPAFQWALMHMHALLPFSNKRFSANKYFHGSGLFDLTWMVGTCGPMTVKATSTWQHATLFYFTFTGHFPHTCRRVPDERTPRKNDLCEALVSQTIRQTGITSCMLYTGWRQGLARVTHQQASRNHMPQTAVMQRSLLGTHKLVLQRERERKRKKRLSKFSVFSLHKTALTQSYNVMPFEIKRGVFPFLTLLLIQNNSLKKL